MENVTQRLNRQGQAARWLKGFASAICHVTHIVPVVLNGEKELSGIDFVNAVTNIQQKTNDNAEHPIQLVSETIYGVTTVSAEYRGMTRPIYQYSGKYENLSSCNGIHGVGASPIRGWIA